MQRKVQRYVCNVCNVTSCIRLVGEKTAANQQRRSTCPCSSAPVPKATASKLPVEEVQEVACVEKERGLRHVRCLPTNVPDGAVFLLRQ